MQSSPSLIELSLASFTGRVADADAVPGSGCVAALQGALGAALVSMAFGHAASEGRSDVPDYMRARAEELRELSRRLLELVDEDARAYRDFLKSAGEARRKAARAALDVPLEVAETALAALRLAAVGAGEVASALWCECAIGARGLEGSVLAGLTLVRANAGEAEHADDERWLAERVGLLPVLEREAARLAQEVSAAGSARSS
jgi:formiminotetrahydrofolate cyclodeaminase